MENQIRWIIKELNVTVFYDECSEEPGIYLPHLNIIIINAMLSEFEKVKALLHELGHASKHHNNYKMYNLTFTLHSKMENEAEEFMVKKIVESRLADPDFNANSFNYVDFLESCDLDLSYEPVVKEIVSNYAADDGLYPIFFWPR